MPRTREEHPMAEIVVEDEYDEDDDEKKLKPLTPAEATFCWCCCILCTIGPVLLFPIIAGIFRHIGTWYGDYTHYIDKNMFKEP